MTLGNWVRDSAASSGLPAGQHGVFALQPSSEPEADKRIEGTPLSALEITPSLVRGTVGCETNNYGTISDGTFQGDVNNYNTISNGTFQRMVFNNGTISGGSFLGDMNNWGTISGGIFLGGYNYQTISGGTFQGMVGNTGTISGGTFQENVYNHGTISNGTFQGKVVNYKTISGGTFKEAVEVNAASGTEATIEGGTFEKRVTLKRSDTPITISNGLFNGEVFSRRMLAPRFPSAAACLPTPWM